MVERLFLAVPRGCLRLVIVIISDHTHLLFSKGVAYANFISELLSVVFAEYTERIRLFDMKISDKARDHNYFYYII